VCECNVNEMVNVCMYMCVCGSYIEVAEVAGAEGGVSESTDAVESYSHFYADRQNSFPVASSNSDGVCDGVCDKDDDDDVTKPPAASVSHMSAGVSALSPPSSVHVVAETSPSAVNIFSLH